MSASYGRLIAYPERGRADAAGVAFSLTVAGAARESPLNSGEAAMNAGFFIQLALSTAAVGVLVGVAAWAKIARPVGPLDEHKARELLAEEFPGRPVEAVWIASDGCGAMAKSGGLALVICRVGDGFALRQIPWPQAVAATFRNGRLTVNLGDPAAPVATIALPSWPPENLKGGLAA